MTRSKFWMKAVLSLLIVLVARPVPAQLTDAQVRDAMKGAADYVKRQQNSNGSWKEMAIYSGGVSALCTLSLLTAGEDVKSEKIRNALVYLRSVSEPAAVYSTALQTMVFCAAEPSKDMPLIVNNVKWLEKAQLKEGIRKGAWGYAPGRGNGDNSNTQFALLALHEAERVGVAVDPETWKLALEYWLRTQKEDGSWAYTEGDQSTGSMTCAGIASVIICGGQLNQGDAEVKDGRVHCCGEQMNNDAVERGLKWLGAKFTSDHNPGSPTNYWHYYLYGVERVGRMSGRRFIGGHDWFREGAERLIHQQDTINRMWRGQGHAEGEPLIATPLALLFLAKGRRPVVMCKLRHGDGSDWDRHRGAVQHLTTRVEQRWRRDLTWQTVDLHAATAEDLLESPVLLLSGHDRLRISGEDEDKLRNYVSRGGFIFAEACCGGVEFDRDFRELMKRLFPDSALRLLPADHPVWFAEQTVDPDFVKPLYGIDACCRTSVVYCPQDLSCYWELSRGVRETGYPEPIKKEIEACLRIGANVITYATNRELRNKLDRPQLVAAQSGELLDRGTLYIPKLFHAGGSDDAPNALPNMLQALRSQGQLRVVIENRMISVTDDALFEHPIVFMHGRRAFRFSPDERKALVTFVERGGILFADAICASPEFSESFRREIEAMFPGHTLARIPPDHPLFTRSFRGFELNRVTLRDPQLRTGNDPLRANLTQISPVLEGLTWNDHLAVIFSPFDLSCALENGASLECKGYVKEDAARLAVNVILFALQQ